MLTRSSSSEYVSCHALHPYADVGKQQEVKGKSCQSCFGMRWSESQWFEGLNWGGMVLLQ